MNDHLKRIRRSQTLHIWGNLIKKKRSQQIVHTFSHLPEHAGVLSNPRDEVINRSDWKKPQQKYIFVNCRHWQIIYKLYRAQVQSALQGVQATCLQRSLRLWPLLTKHSPTGRAAGSCTAQAEQPKLWAGPSPGLTEPPTKRPACWVSRAPKKVVQCSECIARLAKPGFRGGSKSKMPPPTLPFRIQ